MPKRTDIKKILVIGSGPIIIGQAAEFDYAGSQACQSLREEGYEIILINSNPATIMTDTAIADRVYIEPLTVDFAKRVIYKERPDAILGSLGGQTGLNLVVELHEDGILDEFGVEILGTDLHAINRAEDRELFRSLMQEINEPVPESMIVHTVEEAVEFAKREGNSKSNKSFSPVHSCLQAAYINLTLPSQLYVTSYDLDFLQQKTSLLHSLM